MNDKNKLGEITKDLSDFEKSLQNPKCRVIAGVGDKVTDTMVDEAIRKNFNKLGFPIENC